ncbi:hypothetical protein HU200_027485 [Digitaria exilis]|uniref:Epidermal patterning factor-like protein n=1 Tax=Digitaria exilis TaxID=1010633 RepID=A0A835ETH3_9POAL|nr:hypothetical protein HU200_027485 [Digitaria exilis]CAB3484732.1 unnamed protein product [Digitaria exilis]
MSTKESSRVRAPTPTALVLALLLLMGSSSWSRIVADGVRMATPRSGASGPAEAGVLGLGEAAPDAVSSSRRPSTDKPDRTAASPTPEEEGPAVESEEELWAKERTATGSRLPDCAHACGPCSPCRRVMVSFMCAQASESCPVAYRCMCRGRFFRVPAL